MPKIFAHSGPRWGRSATLPRVPLPLALALLALLPLASAAGCATAPYHYGAALPGGPPLEEGECQIERGRPAPVLDTVGWIVGIPSKIMLWNIRADNHHITSETEATLAEYLALNDLDQVKVRLNQYDPGSEWIRLRENKSVAWPWKYTLGTLSLVAYTIIPGRIVGGDHYNPFTNTINLYSDIPVVALHEAGHAKDFANRRYKGTYAAAYLLPIVPLWHEAQATGDAIGYLRDRGMAEQEREAYHVLYPAYGSYVGNEIGWPLLCIVGGHVIGRARGLYVELPDEPPDVTLSDPLTIEAAAPADAHTTPPGGMFGAPPDGTVRPSTGAPFEAPPEPIFAAPSAGPTIVPAAPDELNVPPSADQNAPPAARQVEPFPPAP